MNVWAGLWRSVIHKRQEKPWSGRANSRHEDPGNKPMMHLCLAVTVRAWKSLTQNTCVFNKAALPYTSP